MQFKNDGWLYQTITLHEGRRAQLWFLPAPPFPQQREIGHGKDVPRDMTPGQVIEYTRKFITGEISHEYYNQLLPH